MRFHKNRRYLENRNTASNDQPNRSLETIERLLDSKLMISYG